MNLSNTDFWASIDSIFADGFTPEGLTKWSGMQSHLFQANLLINDFHRSNIMAAQREVAIMSLHPYSREQILLQVASLRRSGASKESVNAQRCRQNI